jgi:hypothetical protein
MTEVAFIMETGIKEWTVLAYLIELAGGEYACTVEAVLSQSP